MDTVPIKVGVRGLEVYRTKGRRLANHAKGTTMDRDRASPEAQRRGAEQRDPRVAGERLHAQDIPERARDRLIDEDRLPGAQDGLQLLQVDATVIRLQQDEVDLGTERLNRRHDLNPERAELGRVLRHTLDAGGDVAAPWGTPRRRGNPRTSGRRRPPSGRGSGSG